MTAPLARERPTVATVRAESRGTNTPQEPATTGSTAKRIGMTVALTALITVLLVALLGVLGLCVRHAGGLNRSRTISP